MTHKHLLPRSAVSALPAASLAAGTSAIAQAEPTHSPGLERIAAESPSSFADIVQRVAPAVVSIDVEGKAKPNSATFPGPMPFGFGDGDQNNPFGFNFRQMFPPQQPDDQPAPKTQASGSGFFISRDGYILTNNHVVDGADKITVKTNGDRELSAKLIGSDPATDLAVIKVEGGGYPFVDFENQAKPRVGDWVIAVGNPFGLGGTATAGIVSALARPEFSGNSYVDYMQIDAPINRGNSGGPTFDVYGRVVGVNSAIFSPSGGSVGIGFDIPADVAQSISQQLITTGKVVRGYIGATIQDVTPEIAESMGVAARQGALVAEVTPDGPSSAAGLESGDLILDVNGRPVTSASDLTRQVALAHAGENLRLKIRRDGSTREIAVRSGVRPSEVALADNDDQGEDGAGRLLGMRLAANPQGGVTIEGIASDSEAHDKGLRRGDVILRAGVQRIDKPADVTSAIDAARHDGRTAILLLVKHQDRRLFVPLKIQHEKG